MNIGEAAAQSTLPAKTIRYYEEIGLLKPARSANGYRSYSEQDVHTLRFLQRARSLGFNVEDCRQLLSLYQDRSRASADVKNVATAHLKQIGEKIRELESMRQTLERLVGACRGDTRPDCPILSDLSNMPAAKEKTTNG
ncbi:MAG: Cu(I)-responsive transcriptional regulator [Pseudomonadota bacterium]